MDIKKGKAVVSKERVLDAAARIFRDAGYYGTTMRKIADHAGLEVGSLYYHYPSKDELIEAVLDLSQRAVLTAVTAAVEAMPAGTPPRERVEKAIQTHLTAILKLGDYALASQRGFELIPLEMRRRHIRLRASYGRFWQQLLQDASDAGEIRAGSDITLVRFFVLGAMNWAVEWYRPGGKSIQDIAQELCDLVFEGLAPAHADAS